MTRLMIIIMTTLNIKNLMQLLWFSKLHYNIDNDKDNNDSNN